MASLEGLLQITHELKNKRDEVPKKDILEVEKKDLAYFQLEGP